MNLLALFGYGGNPHALTDLEALTASGAALIDIRYSPKTGIPGLGREALLRRFGTSYTHLPDLGNRNYRGGPIELVDAERGLEALGAWLMIRPCVLLCGCGHKRAGECHRTEVGRLAQERWPGLEVRELGPGGRQAGWCPTGAEAEVRE